ncbi:MAG: hypothetical protein HYU60_04685 [Magnetospirillum sp.]|nr:hypothetical protein [Magnetospirillum sp.]
MSKTSQFILGGKCFPIDLQALAAEDGQLLPIEDGLVQFDFNFRSVRIAGRYEEADGHARLKIVGDVGPMPFSVESPAARAGLARIVQVASDRSGPLFRIARGRILLGAEQTILPPVTATALVAAVARVLVPAIPYLDLIACYVRPPLAPARPGESALRPEWRRRPR